MDASDREIERAKERLDRAIRRVTPWKIGGSRRGLLVRRAHAKADEEMTFRLEDVDFAAEELRELGVPDSEITTLLGGSIHWNGNAKTGSYTVRVPKSAVTGKFVSESKIRGRIQVNGTVDSNLRDK